MEIYIRKQEAGINLALIGMDINLQYDLPNSDGSVL